GALDEAQVVVDGLRNTDNGNVFAPALNLLGDAQRPLLRAIAAHREQHVQAQLLHAIYDFAGAFAAAARGAEDGAASAVDVAHTLGVEGLDGQLALGQQPPIAVRDAAYLADAITVPQGQDGGADDVVQSRTQAAAGDNRGVRF